MPLEMTIQLARLVTSSCLAVGARSRWSVSIPRRYVQEFPGVRFDNSMAKDYMVVLPEEFGDTSQNELLRIPQAGEPEIDFSKLNPENCFKGMSKVIGAFDDFASDVNNQTSQPPESLSELFREIEKNLFPLDTAYNALMLLLTVEGHKYNYQEFQELLSRYETVRDRKAANQFSALIKKLTVKEMDSLSGNDLRMLRFYSINPSRQRKVQPIDENMAVAYQENLDTDLKHFIMNINLSNRLFSHTVDDPDILAEVSAEFDHSQDLHHKERTPLQVNPNTYHRFMRVCPDRFVRQMLWQSYNKRCSPKGLPKHNNLLIVTNIRSLRRKLANSAGYRSHLEFRLGATMAATKQRALDGLATIHRENSPLLSERLTELYEYAMDNSFTDSSRLGLREYDLDYWSNKYAHDILIGVSEPELRKFFPLKKVMQGIQDYFKKYLSIEFKVTTLNDDPFWKEGIQYMDLERHGEPLGRIVYSPYQRGRALPSAYYSRLRGRVPSSQQLPARFISTPFKRDAASGDANLSVLEVLTMFKYFSTVIQRLMYNYPYYELNTYGGIEPDVKRLLPNLCEAHLLTDHRILQSCSSREGSKPIDSELASRILKATVYPRPLKTWFELYKAHLDLEANATMTATKNLVDELYKIYSPFPRDPDNYDYCSMNEIFVGPNDGLQYSDLWSRQLANFCLAQMMSSDGKLDDSKAKDIFDGLASSMFGPDDRPSEEKLVLLTGQKFEPTKFGLGVL